MTSPRLLACPSCARHVRANESDCPFCASSLERAFANVPPLRRPTARLARAALYAFGATSMTLATACGSSGGGQTDSGSDMSSTPLYGAPCMGPMGGPCGEDAGADGAGSTDGSGDELIAVYGGPPEASLSESAPEAGPTDGGHSG